MLIYLFFILFIFVFNFLSELEESAYRFFIIHYRCVKYVKSNKTSIRKIDCNIMLRIFMKKIKITYICIIRVSEIETMVISI